MMADSQQQGNYSKKGSRSNSRSRPSRTLAESDLKLCTSYLYGKDGCSRGDACIFLHICRFYMLKCCKEGNSCQFSHDLSTRHSQAWFQRKFGINRVQGDMLHKFRDLFGETIRNPPRSRTEDESFRANWEERRQCNLRTLRQFLISLSKAEEASSRETAKNTQQQDDRSKPQGWKKVQVYPPSKSSLPDAKKTQETQVASTTSSASKELCDASSNSQSLQESCPDICLYYLRGTCSFTEQKHGKYRHFSNAFQWQIQDGKRGIWLDLTEETNLKLEQHFCDVTIGEYGGQLLAYYGENKDNILHVRTVTITFGVDTLTINDKSGQLVDVRRLSSMSYTQAGGWIKAYSTHWIWYWQNDHKNWIEFPQKKTGEGNPTPITKNETIEIKYVKFKHKGGPSQLMVTTDLRKWCLDFSCMEQTISSRGPVQVQPLARRPKWKPSSNQHPSNPSSCNPVAGVSSLSSPARPVELAPQQKEPAKLLAPTKEPAQEDVPNMIRTQHRFHSPILDVPVSSDSKELPKPRLQTGPWQKLEDGKTVLDPKMPQVPKVPEDFQIWSPAAADIPKQTNAKLVHQDDESQLQDPSSQITPLNPSGLTEALLPSFPTHKVVTNNSDAPQSLNQEECLYICPLFLKGSCEIKDDKYNHKQHFSTPYQWQFLEQGLIGWKNLPSTYNDSIEISFCDVKCTSFKQSNNVFEYEDVYIKQTLRRLSTSSSVLVSHSEVAFSTEWIWYWQDEKDQWIAYSEKSVKVDQAGINSATIERKYLDYERKQGEPFIEFIAGSQKYKLDFVAMHQTNLRYETCRKVKRRPKFVPMEDRRRLSRPEELAPQQKEPEKLLAPTKKPAQEDVSNIRTQHMFHSPIPEVPVSSDSDEPPKPRLQTGLCGQKLEDGKTVLDPKMPQVPEDFQFSSPAAADIPKQTEWYWQDERDQWIAYSERSVKGDRAGINSAIIEGKYLDYQLNLGESFIEFTAGSHKYKLDFVAMHQTNLRYRTCRKVKRRPKLVPMEERQGLSSQLSGAQQLSGIVPVTWENVGAQKDTDWVFLNDKTSQEYTDIATLFEDTMKDRASIVTIRRIQNMDLWEDFTKMGERMEKKNGGNPVLQKRLFHGTQTRNTAHAICRENFDWRLNGSNVGALYGKGSYFAHDAGLAHRYTKANEHEHRYLFVAQVLVGTYTTGSTTYARPPPKDPLKPHRGMYDSCVDNISNPKKFVIFEKTQAYPEYLIKYKEAAASSTSILDDLLMQRSIKTRYKSIFSGF